MNATFVQCVFAYALQVMVTLDSLNSSELATLCDDMKHFSSSVAVRDGMSRMVCRSRGLAAARELPESDAAGLVAACESAFDDCVENSAPVELSVTCRTSVTSCEATVGTFAKCQSALPSYSDQIVMPCSLLTTDNIATADDVPEDPVACRTFDAMCPDFSPSASQD